MNKSVFLRPSFLVFGALFCLLFTSFSSIAQDNSAIAKKILDDVNARYSALQAMQSNFTILVENSSGGLQKREEGTVFVKGEKYRLETNELVRISDGNTIWTYFPNEKEVQISEQDGDDTEINPAKLYKLYEKGYLLLYMGEDIVEGTTYQYIDLTPLEKSSPYFKIRLTISKTNRLVTQAKIFSRNGIHYTYRIDKVDTKPTPKENSFFSFNTSAYGDIEINDLR